MEKISRETAGPAVADYLPSLWSEIGPWGLFIERPGNFSGPKAKVTGIFEKRRGALQAMEGERGGGEGWETNAHVDCSIRISTAALTKFFTPQKERLFETGVYLKVGRDKELF